MQYMTESNYKSKENNNISDSIPQGTYLLQLKH